MMVTILPQEVGGGACSHLGGSREHFWKQAGLHSYWPTLFYVPHPKDSTTAPKVWPAVGSKCSWVRARTPHSCGETFVINYSWMNIQISKPYTSHNTVKEKEVVRRNKEEKQRKIRRESRLDKGLKNLTSSDWRTNKSSQGLLSIALLKSSQNSAIARCLSVDNHTLGF